MSFQSLFNSTSSKNNSRLCIGLDVDLNKIPNVPDPIFSFNRSIVEATKELVCAYKPNMAFYEMYGLEGLQALIKTIDLIRSYNIPVILDAKRGDIGNSSSAYSKALFDVFHADAVTVAPYMGGDSVAPFIADKDKFAFVLCLTSNPGAADFEMPNELYKNVAKKVVSWNKLNNCGLVVGATKPGQIKEIRQIAPDLLFLIPGIGAQGGDLKATLKAAGKNCIINASRSIIYAKDPQAEAKKLRDEINENA